MVQWLHITLHLCRIGSQYAKRFYLFKKLPLTKATNNVVVRKCEIINLLIAFQCLNKWVHLKLGWVMLWEVILKLWPRNPSFLSQSHPRVACWVLHGSSSQIFSLWSPLHPLMESWETSLDCFWSLGEFQSTTAHTKLLSAELSWWWTPVVCLWKPWRGPGELQGSKEHTLTIITVEYFKSYVT